MTADDSKVIAPAMQSRIEKFIQKAIKVHGQNRYDYSLAVLGDNKTKVKIKCGLHGEFTQRSDVHLRGANCPKCATQQMRESKRRSSVDFVRKAIKKHGNRYDYSNIKTSTVDEYAEIICPKHGLFKQRCDSHLLGSGCPECGGNKKHTKKAFVEKARSVHGLKYDYSSSVYVNNETKLEISCPDHGIFLQQPNSHFNGSGCPECHKEVAGGHSRSAYVERCKLNHDGLTNLYIIKCRDEHEGFYKVGITSLSLKQRFNKGTLPYEYEVLEFFGDEAGFIWDLEKQLHRVLSDYKHQPRKKFSGRFECFSKVPNEVYRLIKRFRKSSQMQLIV